MSNLYFKVEPALICKIGEKKEHSNKKKRSNKRGIKIQQCKRLVQVILHIELCEEVVRDNVEQVAREHCCYLVDSKCI